MAVTDEKLNTRWQDVVISIMGPTFGMLLARFMDRLSVHGQHLPRGARQLQCISERSI